MAKPENNEVWDGILAGLPTTPSPKDQIPLPEILRVIQFCLKDGVEQYEAAVDLADVLSKLRNDIEFLNWKAMVEYDAKKYIKSFESAQKVLNISKDPGSYFNAGRAAYKANELALSKEYLQKAMDLDPKNSSYILDYAVTVCTMGDFDGALKIIENIDKSELDDLHAKIVDFNKGWHYVRQGKFKEGMALINIGRTINVWGSDSRKWKKPRWDGVTYPGKTILIAGEGGIGDEVINARFGQLIKERGMNAIMSTVHKNTSMLSSVPYIDKVIEDKDVESAEFDYWVPCMDMPQSLGIESTDIPSKPYLKAKQEYIDKWKVIIKGRTDSGRKLNIGIRWMGNPRYELELARTIPNHYFESLKQDGVALYSLQKDDGIKNLTIPRGVIDISDKLETWDDTMGAMANLDLIITSCTSIAHVAGALGRPTWVVTPLLPYYTWADMKKESYWYGSVSLYRQRVWKDWSHPFTEIQHDLKKLLEVI
jgi:tetratricopeptide (TPR) repeat protein